MVSSWEDDSLSGTLRRAAEATLADVDAVGAEGNDRAILLKALLEARLRSIGSRNPPEQDSKQTPHSTIESGQSSHTAEETDLLSKMSATLKVDREKLELVYDIRDGQPGLVISGKKISSNRAQATRQIGQLVAVGRQASGIEEWTSVNVIRSAVQDYGRLDSGNFASNIQQIDNICVIRGKGQQRELKVTRPGLEETADLIRTLTGQTS